MGIFQRVGGTLSPRIHFCAILVAAIQSASRSTNGGGRGCHKFVPVSGGDGTKIAPSEDLFDQPSGEMS